MRVRKAWLVSIRGYEGEDVVYAPSASKAKGQKLYDLIEAGYEAREAFAAMRVRRCADRDVLLPERHDLADELTGRQRWIVIHSFAANSIRAGYRNHYFADPVDLPDVMALAEVYGLMTGPLNESGYGDTGMWCARFFRLTELGQHIALGLAPLYPRQ